MSQYAVLFTQPRGNIDSFQRRLVVGFANATEAEQFAVKKVYWGWGKFDILLCMPAAGADLDEIRGITKSKSVNECSEERLAQPTPEAFDALKARVAELFNGLNNRIGDLEGRYIKLHDRIAKMEHKLDVTANVVDRLNRGFKVGADL